MTKLVFKQEEMRKLKSKQLEIDNKLENDDLSKAEFRKLHNELADIAYDISVLIKEDKKKIIEFEETLSDKLDMAKKVKEENGKVLDGHIKIMGYYTNKALLALAESTLVELQRVKDYDGELNREQEEYLGENADEYMVSSFDYSYSIKGNYFTISNAIRNSIGLSPKFAPINISADIVEYKAMIKAFEDSTK